jgi:hypothetical protein
MVLRTGHFRKYNRNIRKVLKCGAAEEWRRSVGPIVLDIGKYYTESSRREEYPTHNKKTEG